VAYVDNDPIVISHARSLLAKSPGVIAVPGDMRDPGRILADAGLTDLIDLAQPACVILCAILHFADAGTARIPVLAGNISLRSTSGSHVTYEKGPSAAAGKSVFFTHYRKARGYVYDGRPMM
jgi:hypothetical protein